MRMRENGLWVGIGAPSQDLYLPEGIVWPNYDPGEKNDFKDEDYKLLDAYREYEADIPQDQQFLKRRGGNMLNTLTALQSWGHKTRFVGVVAPEGDIVSDDIRAHFAAFGMEDGTVQVPDYVVSTGVIMRGKDETTGKILDREVRGIPRGPMREHLTDEVIAEGMKGAGIVSLASLKDPVLNERVLRQAKDLGVPTTVNYGSNEFKTHPHRIREVSSPDTVTLIALNEKELSRAYRGSKAATERLAARASHDMAKFVLATMGEDGVAFAHNGDVLSVPIARLGRGQKVIDTLGAGDRAHALAAYHLFNGAPLERIPEIVAQGTIDVITAIGAHGDLRPGANSNRPVRRRR